MYDIYIYTQICIDIYIYTNVCIYIYVYTVYIHVGVLCLFKEINTHPTASKKVPAAIRK